MEKYEAVISVRYRVNSIRATQFRRSWRIWGELPLIGDKDSEVW